MVLAASGGDAADARAHRAQLLLDALVAAVDVVDALDHRLALCLPFLFGRNDVRGNRDLHRAR